MKRVAYYQFNPVLGEPQTNLGRVAAVLDTVQADLVVLPELAFSGYCIPDRLAAYSLSESPEDSPTLERLVRLCRKNGYHIVTGFAERDGEQVYNSAALVGPSGVVGIYRKIHLFGFESELFVPGNRRPEVYDIGGLKVGMMICFDWIFPETARLLALAGADIIAHPSNLVLDWCQTAMVTRCLENNLFSITANRYGSESRNGKTLRFTGFSRICAPRGKVLADGPESCDELRIVDIEPSEARDKRLSSGNELFDERWPRMYQGLCQ